MSSSDAWEEIDADRHTYYGVAIGEDYSFTPDAVFLSKEAADGWVEWQKSLWTEEEEKGIHPNSEVFVLPVRDLQGKVWNSYDPVPE